MFYFETGSWILYAWISCKDDLFQRHLRIYWYQWCSLTCSLDNHPKELSCPKLKGASPRCSQRLQCLNSCRDYKLLQMLYTETTHGCKMVKCGYILILINFCVNLFSLRFLCNQNCDCPSYKSCQRFTWPNLISASPRQSDRGFWRNLVINLLVSWTRRN